MTFVRADHRDVAALLGGGEQVVPVERVRVARRDSSHSGAAVDAGDGVSGEVRAEVRAQVVVDLLACVAGVVLLVELGAVTHVHLLHEQSSSC